MADRDTKPIKMTARQRAVLAAVIRAELGATGWYRAADHGERVTLASLFRHGFLERSAWRGREGDADAAYEYRPRDELMSVVHEVLDVDKRSQERATVLGSAIRTGATAAWLADPANIANGDQLKLVAALGLPKHPKRWHYTCADGFTLSIQASLGLRCEPANNDGPWSALDVGSLRMRDDIIAPWREAEDDEPDAEVYPFTPIEVVDTLIAAHDAVARVRSGCLVATVLIEALRLHGEVTHESPNPSNWTVPERLALVHGLALLDAFEGS